ncbi:rhodanese-like domain-containing protein [Enterococcus mundtii]|nr:rhodanese-like domain-containing protein [Enterococcus mundtii]
MIKSITVHELYFVYQKKDVVILDVRKTNEYIKKHLSHSISIPITSLPAQLNNLDTKKQYYIVGASNHSAQEITSLPNRKRIASNLCDRQHEVI